MVLLVSWPLLLPVAHCLLPLPLLPPAYCLVPCLPPTSACAPPRPHSPLSLLHPDARARAQALAVSVRTRPLRYRSRAPWRPHRYPQPRFEFLFACPRG